MCKRLCALVPAVVLMTAMMLIPLVFTRYLVTRDYNPTPSSSSSSIMTNKCVANPQSHTLYTPYQPDQCLATSQDTWSSAGTRLNNEGCMCLERCIDGECHCPYNGIDIDGFYSIWSSVSSTASDTACRQWPDSYDNITIIVITEYIIALVYAVIMIQGLIYVRRLWLDPEQRHIEREVIAICAVFVGALAMNDWLFAPLSSRDRTSTNVIIPRVLRQLLTEVTIFVTVIFGRRIGVSWRVSAFLPIVLILIRLMMMIVSAAVSTNMLTMTWLVNLGFDFVWCIWSLFMMTCINGPGAAERKCLQFTITPCLIMISAWVVLQVMQPFAIKIAHGYHIVECTLEASWWALLFKLFWNTRSITRLMESRRPRNVIGVSAAGVPAPVARATPVQEKMVAVVANNTDDNTTAATEVELEGYDTTRGEGQVAYAYATPVIAEQQPGLQLASHVHRGMLHIHVPARVDGVAVPAASSVYAVLVAPSGGYVPLQT